MLMCFSQLLVLIGVDAPDAVARFGGQEALLRRFLLKFPQDPTFGALDAAYNAGDIEALTRQVHTLKGVTANLGLAPLSRLAADYLAALRAGTPLSALDAQYEGLCAEYRRVTEAIARFSAGNPA